MLTQRNDPDDARAVELATDALDAADRLGLGYIRRRAMTIGSPSTAAREA